MDRTRTSLTRRGLALAALALAPSLVACADMHAFVTGDQFYKASKDARRVEAELVVQFDEGLFDGLQEGVDTEALETAITEMVHGLADVGMRFYPILSDTYGKKDKRPAHLMIVQVESLTFNTNHEMIEEKDKAPWMHSTVKSMDCTVTTSVQKRRNGGPPLVIGRAQATGHRGTSSTKEGEQPTTYELMRESEEHQQLQVKQEDVLDTVEEAVVDALRDIVEPIDRELEGPDDEQQ